MSGRGAFLDCRPLGPALMSNFPTVVATCQSAGIDSTREPIPVVPAAHYHMGGVLTDAQGRSTVDGLWACGEVTSTGAHGANRLASNSLLEAVVFGARVAHDIGAMLPPPPSTHVAAGTPSDGAQGHNEEAERALRQTMSAGVGVLRDAESLTRALSTIATLQRESDGDRRLANMLTTAKLIAAAALLRTESRGAHFRSDYPALDEAQAKRSFLTLAKADEIVREAAGIASPPCLRVVSQG
jgi:L-aspartate oxidase